MVNIELYRVFYFVAKTGSSTRAAEMMFKTQPAVSQALRQLENQLQTKLFVRTHTGMQLTEIGDGILGQVEQALRLLDDVENKLSEFNATT